MKGLTETFRNSVRARVLASGDYLHAQIAIEQKHIAVGKPYEYRVHVNLPQGGLRRQQYTGILACVVENNSVIAPEKFRVVRLTRRGFTLSRLVPLDGPILAELFKQASKRITYYLSTAMIARANCVAHSSRATYRRCWATAPDAPVSSEFFE